MSNPFVVLIENGVYRETVLKKEEMDFMEFHFFHKEKWYVSLKEKAFFLDFTKVKALEDGLYEIDNGNIENSFLFVSLLGKKENYCLYKVNDDLFSPAGIELANPALKDYSFSLVSNRLLTDCDFVFVNSERVYREKILHMGDHIFILGTDIIYMSDFIYTNNFLLMNHLPKYEINADGHPYPIQKKMPSDNILQTGNVIPEIEDIRPFSFEYKANTVLNRSLIPQIILTCSMAIMSLFNILNGIDSGRSIYQLLTLVVMPVGMILSLVVCPFIEKKREKRKENILKEKATREYLVYLDEIKKKMEDACSYYEEISELFCFRKRGRIPHDHILFSSVLLGFRKIKEVQSPFPGTNKEISKKVYEIRTLADRKVPFLLKLNKRKTVTLLVKESKKEYCLKCLLSQLTRLYSPDELKIVLFTKKELPLSILSLPHLFHRGIRMTYRDESKLKRVCDFSFSGDVILLADEEIHLSFINPKIHVVQLKTKMPDSVNEELTIDLRNRRGVLLNTGDYFDICHYEFGPVLENYSCFNYMNEEVKSGFLYTPVDIKREYEKSHHDLISTFGISDGKPFSLDFHESKDGPHAIIAGTTGSGKSELLVSLILSMICHYPPDYLNVIIIDYKGGGIAESFCQNSKRVPHLVASLSNIDGSSFERFLIKISFELKKRQCLFLDLSRKLRKTITSIDEYQVHHSMAHLFIVIDEFAELKKNYPEEMKELISFSRIGRSLGIHLILMSQRTNGNINDEILSNCSTRLALRMNDPLDSRTLISSNDACNLKKSGEFVCLTPQEKSTGQSFYSKKEYIDEDEISLSLLDENLYPVRTVQNASASKTSQVEKAVLSIIEASEEIGYSIPSFEFERSSSMESAGLKKKYGYTGNDLVLGETDDYENDLKELLIHPLKESAVFLSDNTGLIADILNSLSVKNYAVIVNEKSIYPHSLTLTEEEDILFLLKKAGESKEEGFLIVEDLGALFENISSSREAIRRLLKKRTEKRTVILAFLKEKDASERIVTLFDRQYSLLVKDKRKQAEFFFSSHVADSDSCFFKDRLIGFVPVLFNLVTTKITERNWLKRIPESIRKEDNLIGYEITERKKIKVTKRDKIAFSVIDNIEKKKWERFYSSTNLTFILESAPFKKEEYDGIIFTDFTIRQMLCPRDFQKKEGCLVFVYKGKWMNVRPVNHE